MQKTYKVINQTPFEVHATNKNEYNYVFESADTDNNEKDLTIEEIAFINQNTGLFKIGYLTISDEHKEEVFSEIGLKNYQDILSRDEIIECIEVPSNENIEKLISVTNFSLYKRVYTELLGLLSIPNDISNRVIKILELRYDELAKGKIQTDIVLNVVNEPKSKREEKLEKDLEQLKAMVKQLSEQKEIEDKPKKTGRTNKKETDKDE